MANPRRFIARLVCGAVAVSLASSAAVAQTPVTDLSTISLEDLMNIQITSASRKEQRAADTAAAVYVITQDDIRRSGVTSLPELFRLVPGMQVAQINSNNWAISSRGFNDLWSNKLLVLIDGRSTYTRSFSGVQWPAQDLLLDDIDRIEVIRGPGASVWGANAVNGVINIVTRAASDTQGTLVKIGAGTYDRTQGAVRYGGAIGSASYRIFSQWSEHSSSLTDAGAPAGDRWRNLVNGFRADWTRGPNAVTTEGSILSSELRPLWTSFTGPTPSLSGPAPFEASTATNGNALARWTRTLASGASIEVQSSVDLRRRHDGNGVAIQDDVFDFDIEARRTLANRHDVVAGGGYRAGRIVTDGMLIYSTVDRVVDTRVLSGFVQDDIALTSRYHVIVGSKLEHDFIAGWGVQPTARFIWNVTPSSQRVWAAVSQALRTPSTNDVGFRLNFAAFTGDHGVPVLIGMVGNPEYQSERLVSLEGGYRVELRSKVSADISVFRGQYDRLPTDEPMAPRFETTPGPPHLFVGTKLSNLLQADTQGIELAAHWTPTAAWRFDASYATLGLTPHVDASSRDPLAAQLDGNAPAEQWQLHTSAWLGSRVELDGGVYFVGRTREAQVSAYTRADAQATFKLSGPLSMAITGQNLLDRAHAEFGNANTGLTATEIPRSLAARLTWKF